MGVPNIFYPVVTDDGLAAAISESDAGLSLSLTHVSFGTGQYNPTGAETALFNEVEKVPISGAMRGNPNRNVLRAVGVWSDLAAESEIGEIGFWAGTTLFAVWSREVGGPVGFKTLGVEFVAFMELVFENVPAGSITISINPLVPEALSAIVTHETDPFAHPQYLLRSDYVNAHNLATAQTVGGTANAIVLTLPPESAITGYTFGQRITFIAAANNTGPVTVNVDGRGLRNVTSAGNPLSIGDLNAGSVYTLFYDGTDFQISGGIGGGSTFLRHDFTAAAAQDTFTVSYPVGAVLVIVNGRFLQPDDYDASTGTEVVLVTPCEEDDTVSILVFKAYSVINHWTKEESDARYLQVSEAASLSPPGMIAHFARETAPTGWLKANGALVSRTTYAALFAAIGTRFGAGDGSTTFRVPDLRGEFVRGWDDSRGIDTGRVLGSFQSDELKAHTHSYDKINLISNGELDDNLQAGSSFGAATTGSTGGSETRPRNIALLACIRYA